MNPRRQHFYVTDVAECNSTTVMFAKCALCDPDKPEAKWYSAISHNYMAARRLIQAKSRKHVAAEHAGHPQLNYTSEERLLCAIFGVATMEEVKAVI